MQVRRVEEIIHREVTDQFLLQIKPLVMCKPNGVPHNEYWVCKGGLLPADVLAFSEARHRYWLAQAPGQHRFYTQADVDEVSRVVNSPGHIWSHGDGVDEDWFDGCMCNDCKLDGSATTTKKATGLREGTHRNHKKRAGAEDDSAPRKHIMVEASKTEVIHGIYKNIDTGKMCLPIRGRQISTTLSLPDTDEYETLHTLSRPARIVVAGNQTSYKEVGEADDLADPEGVEDWGGFLIDIDDDSPYPPCIRNPNWRTSATQDRLDYERGEADVRQLAEFEACEVVEAVVLATNGSGESGEDSAFMDAVLKYGGRDREGNLL